MIWSHLSLHPRFVSIVFPWPTFMVNVIGCLLIGFFYQYSERWGLTAEGRLMLTTGLCGGFTTFSTFSYESMNLLRNGHISTFFIYLILSLVLGFIAVLIPVLFSK